MLPSVVICNRGFSMKLSVAIQDDLIEAEVRKYTPKTIKGKKTDLGLFLCFCEDFEDFRIY